MSVNLRGSDEVAVIGSIDPRSASAGTYNTGWANLENFHKGMAILQLGNIPNNATVNAALWQATSAVGGNPKVVGDKAISAVNDTGDNKQYIINFSADELDIVGGAAGGYDFIQLRVTTTGSSVFIGGLVLGMSPRYGPASDHDEASVEEIVS